MDLQKLCLKLEAADEIGLEEIPVPFEDLSTLIEELLKLRTREARLDIALSYAKGNFHAIGYRRADGCRDYDPDDKEAERARKIYAEIQRLEEGK